MTRSEPPAEVVEALIDALNAAAGCNDLSDIANDLLFSHACNQLQSVEIICRDAIEAYEKATSLLASSSLGGIEGGVARPQTASAPQVLDIVRRPPAIIDDREARQKSVHEWCSAAFGADAASSVAQRGVRLFEEAVELYQAAGCERTMGHLLIDFVFDRPKGKLAKEIGQVGLVLLSMAEAAGVSADEEEVKEVFRVREKPLSHYAARNQAKNAAGFNTASAGDEVAGQVRGVSAEPQPPTSSPAGALTAEKADVERDAMRWRALLSSASIRWLGSAGFYFDGEGRPLPKPGEPLHFGLEFWDTAKDRGNPQGVTVLTAYANILAVREGLIQESTSGDTRGEATASPSSARERREIIEECAKVAEDFAMKPRLHAAEMRPQTVGLAIRDAIRSLSSDGRGREGK